MDYLTTGISLRQEGIALIAIGSFLIGLGWHFVRIADRTHPFLTRICRHTPQWASDLVILVLVVVCMVQGMECVGEGGNKTTQGWNMVGKHDDKLALITGLARDWAMNDIKLGLPPLTIPDNDPSFGKLQRFYPRFKTTASHQILESGLLASKDSSDAALLAITALYEMVMDDYNWFIPLIDQQLAGAQVRQPQRLEKYESMQKASVVTQFRRVHETLGSYLKMRHPELLSAAQQDIRLVSDALRSKPANVKGADGQSEQQADPNKLGGE
ncbi:MAG: hypothetical protein ABFE13_07900 [Phycisphaerales bacterium]